MQANPPRPALNPRGLQVMQDGLKQDSGLK